MTISITQEGKIPVTPGGVGLFLEDLNYALDGGLYAELLENRNFEAKDVHGEWDRYIVDNDGAYGWSPFPEGADVAMKIKTDRPLFAENPHYMRVTAAKPFTGIKNKAYDGTYLQKGVEYKISFWVRAYDYKSKVAVGFYRDGAPVFQKKLKVRADGKWHKCSVRMKAKADMDGLEFAFVLLKEGILHVDCFSVMPQNAILGVFRRDLVKLMREIKPGFLRFPGGCVVEGNNLENRYLWKESVGDRERRRHNWNRWAVHAASPENGFRTPYSHYGQTLGVGYYEYFRLAEYLGAKPLPVVSVGIACQYMSSEFVPLDSSELERYIQDVFDLIEFANGGTETMWGRLRAELGHPAPFNLELIGVGNEQWEASPVQKTTGMPAPNEFYKRFELFEKRIHERYPNIKIVGTAGPTVDSESHKSAWEWTRNNLARNPDFVYCTDEHFYVSPQWLYDHVSVYDDYPREGKVYAGEYAAHVPEAGCALFNAPQANCWKGALAEAAFMTGMERNSDVVVMKSYAPLFARYGYTQWSPDLIWFDGKQAYATANYHVQKLYSLYTGDFALKTECGQKDVYCSATERDGFTYLKAVNASEEEVPVDVEGDFELGSLTRIICMTAAPDDYNTREEPDKVVPFDIAPEAPRSATLPPHSFNVLVFRKTNS